MISLIEPRTELKGLISPRSTIQKSPPPPFVKGGPGGILGMVIPSMADCNPRPPVLQNMPGLYRVTVSYSRGRFTVKVLPSWTLLSTVTVPR